jgi:ornithine carbamoyltransferase
MKKDLLTLLEFNKEELEEILALSAKLKRGLRQGKLIRPLKDKTVALIFEKPSLRTHCTFDTGIWQLGGHPVTLPPANVNIGTRESVEDVARNLERWVQGIVIRTFSQDTVEKLAKNASVPVINALTDDHHPCQALATGLTLQEHFGGLKKLSVAYIGDGNNVAVSLFILCAKLGIHAALACPGGYEIKKTAMEIILAEAKKTGAKISVTRDPAEAVRGANLVYTDKWASMGQEKEYEARKKIFSPYQVTAELMARAAKGARFSHCLPAERGNEVAADVMDGKDSVVFDEAENRLHVQKAVMMRLIG